MPKVTLTREALIALEPCDLPVRLRMFGNSDSMGVREAFDAGFEVADVLWVAGKLGLAQDCARAAMLRVRATGVDSDGRSRAQIKELLVNRSGTTFTAETPMIDQNCPSTSPAAPSFTGLTITKVDGAGGYIGIYLAGDAARTVNFHLEVEVKSILKP